MKVTNPSCEYWPQENGVEHVCRCAQVSYQSTPKTGEDAKKFYNALKKRGHNSVFRHESRYFKVPKSQWDIYDNFAFDPSPYIDYKETGVYVATNSNFVFDNEDLLSKYNCHLLDWEITPEEFMKECPELMRLTFCLTTQISTSRELNRVK